MAKVLRLADFGTALALAREVQAVLWELRRLDDARALWVHTENLIAEVSEELGSNRQIEPDIYGSDGKISSALGAQMALAFQGMSFGPDGYTEGYRAGCDAFRQRIDRRIAEIKSYGDNLKFHSPDSPGNLRYGQFMPSVVQVGINALYERLPPDRAEWQEELSERVATVLERFQAYSGVREGLPVARVLVAQLSELDDFDSVALGLSKAEETLYKLQCQLAKLWSDSGLTLAEISWRNTLAKELREQAAEFAANTGWSGDNFVRGYTMASSRLARSFVMQAEKIAVPDHLCPGLRVSQ